MKLSLYAILTLPLVVQCRRISHFRSLQAVPAGFYDDYPYPEFRFTPWEELDEKTLAQAAILGYDKELWNQPLSNEIEWYAFNSIGEAFSEEVVNTIIDMGFTQSSWDCWVNHYIDFTWGDFVYYEFEESMMALGWDEAGWESVDPNDWPESENKSWDELTYEERMAAKDICYKQEMFDKLPITEWIGTSKPTESPTLATIDPDPTAEPTHNPSNMPSDMPSLIPSMTPTTSAPTDAPSSAPTATKRTLNPTVAETEEDNSASSLRTISLQSQLVSAVAILGLLL